MRRSLFDLASQFLALGASLLDRIVLTAMLLRVWGVDTFEYWLVLTATVTMLSIADMGSQISFSNKIASAAHQGKMEAAARVYRESNTIFLSISAAVLALAIMLAYFEPLQRLVGLSTPVDKDGRFVLLAVGLYIALRMTMSNQLAVYRACLATGRGTIIMSAVDVLRIVFTILAAVAGTGIVGAAVAMIISAVAGHLIWVSLDIARHYPQFRYRVSMPTPFTYEGQIRRGLLYSVQFVPSVIMVQLPVVIIGAGGRAAAGVLTGYVLMRTLNNFLRTLILKFTYILGMELGRLETQRRLALLDRTYRLSARFLACCFGFIAAMLLGLGPEMTRLWVGTPDLFDPLILGLMLLPLVLTPTVQVASALLNYSNRPGPLAVAVSAQLGVAVLFGIFLPIEDISLRLTVAIFATEILPLAPILLWAARRPITLAVLIDEALPTLLAIGTFVATYLVLDWTKPLLGDVVLTIAAAGLLTLVFAGLLAAAFAKPFRSWRASK